MGKLKDERLIQKCRYDFAVTGRLYRYRTTPYNPRVSSCCSIYNWDIQGGGSNYDEIKVTGYKIFGKI